MTRPRRVGSRRLRGGEISIRRETQYIIDRARRHDARLVTLGALIFFSTETGDAWVLDRQDHLAICLARDGVEQPYAIAESATGFAIEWTGRFELDGDAFTYADNSGHVRTVLGYPVAEIRRAL